MLKKSKHIKFNICACSLACLSVTNVQAEATDKNERPNILWLTFEDSSWYEFGCYGNEQVQTPVIDSLAKSGLQFMNVWSVAPQSSPARSSLITGCYATTYGMDLHPQPSETPEKILFPQYLRENGYFCTNNKKTHYNTTLNHKSCWDECGKKASYNSKNRKENQPFFAIFNTATSHMGRIRTFHTDARRDYTEEGIYPEKLKLPPHVPDLYEIRSDYAGHLEAIQDVDKWVGYFIKDLKDKGLYDNTIIFVFSDHGGCLPRGKGYLYETGLHVPLIVSIPPKWQHLSPEKMGVKDKSLVSFIDFAPTVLNLSDVKKPNYMQGKAFLGKNIPKFNKKIQFAFGTNQLHHFMPVRAATDGRYKYIRSYIPYKQFAMRNYYQWGMPSNKAWDRYILENCNANSLWQQPYRHHKPEMLFDLSIDPFELNNLSDNPKYQKELTYFRDALSAHIRSSKDLGFFLPTSRKNGCLFEKVRNEKFPLEKLYQTLEIASNPNPKDISFLDKALKNKYPEIRYWAAVGFAQLATTNQLNKPTENLLQLLKDKNSYVACEAAYALVYLGKDDMGIQHLLTPKKEAERKIGYSLLECISLDRTKKNLLLNYVDELKNNAESLPDMLNEDAGLMARGILVNLGHWDIRMLHGKTSYEKGLELNRKRRAKVPLP